MKLPSLSQWPAVWGLGSWTVGKTGVSSSPAASRGRAVFCRRELPVSSWSFSEETSLARPSLKQPDPRLGGIWSSKTLAKRKFQFWDWMSWTLHETWYFSRSVLKPEHFLVSMLMKLRKGSKWKHPRNSRSVLLCFGSHTHARTPLTHLVTSSNCCWWLVVMYHVIDGQMKAGCEGKGQLVVISISLVYQVVYIILITTLWNYLHCRDKGGWDWVMQWLAQELTRSKWRNLVWNPQSNPKLMLSTALGFMSSS